MEELETDELARLCQAVYRLRRARPRLMVAASDLFADPVWDIMLDLYVASRRGQLTTVTNACVAAHVPQTTGLRYIEKLTARGLAVRYSHLKDKRMLGLELTPEGMSAMEDMLRELSRLLGEAGYTREGPQSLCQAV